jgi:5'-nucleotidase
MKAERPLILVTNDDGIHAGGLGALIEIASEIGDVVVVAPEESQSGMSHAITTKQPIRVNRKKEQNGLKIYSCSGTPVDCVKLALNQLLDRKPDLLLSGINHGSNASISVIYSGTMAAAIEGSVNGIQSVGFSLLDYSPDADFRHAKHYVRRILQDVLKNGMPAEICLNVNIPVLSTEKIKGIKVCRQTRGFWQEEFDKRTDPFKRDYFWLTGYFNNFEPDARDTDEWALKNGYVSVVPIRVDFTCFDYLPELKKRKF